ncbi:MAG TPA: class I SAM-dependent methyltransferase [Pseudonocardiaceae bacterium]|jgi:SAM-dependent methyltransferase|nr:class I SAM-dependent methyltransferase [Pseudonocardiaceae bacterium]
MSTPCADEFGDPTHPLLLLAGVGDAEFAARLAAGARYVLRRDGSTTAELTALLDEHGQTAGVHLAVPADRAELAREAADARPDRIASLVLVGDATVAADVPTLVVTDDDPVPAILHHTSGGWDSQADRLAAIAIAAGQPTAWFEQLYSSARRGEVPMPWNRSQPQRLLVAWTDGRTGEGRRALVVGCGLGADAEHLASLGYDTDAFDVSESAIAAARARHPGSPVHYRTANLLDPPAELVGAFDLVVEIFTVQALPTNVRATAIANVGRFVGPNGTLIAIGSGQDEKDGPVSGPPWPLTRPEVESFATRELIQVRIADHRDPDDPGWFRWLAEFRHVGKAVDDQ